MHGTAELLFQIAAFIVMVFGLFLVGRLAWANGGSSLRELLGEHT